MAMSAKHAVPHVFLPAIIAVIFVSFTQYIHAQQCRMAHDKNALKALQERAVAGDADAQCGLGRQFEFALGVPQDNKQAAHWLQKSAEQGNIIAQVELGVVFDKMQDYAQALLWYRKAAEQGNARAEYNIGLAYQDGESVPKDAPQAMVWYRKAADQGDAMAQVNIGVMYDVGNGVPQDYAQAAEWYRKAADQGIALAAGRLGDLYHTGHGVPKDDAKSAEWFRKAAEQGYPTAQFDLAAQYTQGAGISRDYEEAYFWMSLAATSLTDSEMRQQALKALEGIATMLKKDDIKRAEKRAQAWLKDHPGMEQ
jgi:hypothetical protein